MLTPIYLDMRDITIKSLRKNLKFSKYYVQNIWQVVRRWHHQLTHLHIHTDWSRNVSWKFATTWKCHNFLICQPIFIRFSLFSSENFTLSSEIKLDQLRASPLRRRKSPLFDHQISNTNFFIFIANQKNLRFCVGKIKYEHLASSFPI